MSEPSVIVVEDRNQARRLYSLIRRTAFLAAVGVTGLVCVSIPVLAVVGAVCLLTHH